MRRYRLDELIEFAGSLLTGAGLRDDIARVVARRIVEADLYGHDTHGLQLLPRYLEELSSGQTAKDRQIETVRDTGACLMLDAHKLSGHWVMEQAMTIGVERAPRYGSATIAVRRSQHIGALQVYLPMATSRGLVAVLWVTDSLVKSVAPFGGVDPVLTSEPIAAGLPTNGDPILIDTTTSLTSNGFVKRAYQRGERLPWKALLSPDGELTDAPSVLFGKPPGTILPVGGMTHGYKGYALAMLVSAMSLGLPGWGRLSGDKSQGFLVQVLDPDAFAGRQAFQDECQWMVDATRSSKPIPGQGRPRVPGERSLALARRQSVDGVSLNSGIVDDLQIWAKRLVVPMPASV